MKAADYRIPWGRPSEHLLAVKREIAGQQSHMQRVNDARNRCMVDTDTPECAHMPHLTTRPKKKKMQEDRQREIAAENYSLMHRLASIMKEERGDPVQKYSHLSVEYRESLRRKKLLKLETENRRLARSIKIQKPFYSTWAMEKEEDKRQALLKTMSRTERRKERVALFAAASRGHRHPGNIPLAGGGEHGPHSSYSNLDAAATASLVDDGVLFRPGPSAVKVRTARQMRAEVAKRRQGPHEQQVEGYCSSPGGAGAGEEPDGDGSDGGGGKAKALGGIRKGVSHSSTDSITVKTRAYSSYGLATAAADGSYGGRGVVLEVNRTGGGRGRNERGAGGRARSWEGRPNLIFTPSLVPVGMDAVRMRPLSLGDAGRQSSLRLTGEANDATPGDTSGVKRPGEGIGGESEGMDRGKMRVVQTV